MRSLGVFFLAMCVVTHVGCDKGDGQDEGEREGGVEIAESAVLEDGDPREADSDSLYDEYRIRGERLHFIIVEMSSDEFHPVLRLYEPSGAEVANEGGMAPTATLAYQIPAAIEYVLHATTPVGSAGGNYRIHITTARERPVIEEPPTEAAGGSPPSVPLYEASCTVQLWQTGSTTEFVHGRGESAPTPEAAVASAWEALCPQIGLQSGCGQDPPGDVRVSQSCSEITANDQVVHSCVLTASVRHERQRVSRTVTRTGTDAETVVEPLCAEALRQACAEVGAEPGCTEGEEPAWAHHASPERHPVP